MPVRLFVGNLPYDVTESELKEFFAGAGPVGQVFMPVDRETGKRRGFAFVEFDDRETAEQAVKKFNNQMLKGRAISVNEARPKEAGAPRGGGHGFVPGSRPMPMGPPPPLEPRSRNFGAARSARNRRQPGRQAAGEERKKGPIRERRMGRLFGLESDDLYDDDKSSLSEAQDEQEEELE